MGYNLRVMNSNMEWSDEQYLVSQGKRRKPKLFPDSPSLELKFYTELVHTCMFKNKPTFLMGNDFLGLRGHLEKARIPQNQGFGAILRLC